MDNFLLQSIDEGKSLKVALMYEDYARSFLVADDPEYYNHIHLKYEHIRRVREEMQGLCKSLGMDAQQTSFADMLAILHDIGRFEQFDRYRTFADAESENHSQMAWRIVEETGIIHEFSGQQAEILRQSILNHNLPAVPDSAPEAVKFYSRLLRDADKLDIWRVSLEYKIFHRIREEVLAEEYVVPEKMMNHFLEHTIILLREVESYYDSILFRISWVYDLNFRHSRAEFKRRRIAARMLEMIPYSPELDRIHNLVETFLEQCINSDNQHQPTK